MSQSQSSQESASPPVPPFLELCAISSAYEANGVRLPVLAGISLSLADEEFVAVVGPSGSGKSTLLDLIAGLIEPDDGQVRFSGVATPANERLGRSAYMKQRDLLLPWRSVRDNAALTLEVSGVSRREARARVDERLDQFGLGGFADVYPAQLSGGMRQRAALLRTMLSGKSSVLLDEPFGALDAITRSMMQDWLLARVAGDRRTLLLVTHDVEEAIYLADRVLVLSGRPAHVAHIESITLSRPRSREMVTGSPFISHRKAIMAALGLLRNEIV